MAGLSSRLLYYVCVYACGVSRVAGAKMGMESRAGSASARAAASSWTRPGAGAISGRPAPRAAGGFRHPPARTDRGPEAQIRGARGGARALPSEEKRGGQARVGRRGQSGRVGRAETATVTPGRHCPCERHLSISARGPGAREADVIAESLPSRGRREDWGRRGRAEPGGLGDGWGEGKEGKINSSCTLSPRALLWLHGRQYSNFSYYFSSRRACLALSLGEGNWSRSHTASSIPGSTPPSQKPGGLTLLPDPAPSLPGGCSPPEAAGLRKAPGMDCAKSCEIAGGEGELINVGLAQRVGELATAWVGGPGRTRGDALGAGCL